MPRLVSVNVGLPRDVAWKGRTVHTGIWKAPVSGRRHVRRLNLDGDGQGDLAGHGGEQRAVFVYQLESYRYWQEQLRRDDFVHGQFGENFTVEGLPDDAVCIGDRYQIGSAVFEITQPRVTCYRVGIRMNEPRMPALLTSSGRPGFYFRVLGEGEVAAGDEIVKVGEADGANDRCRDQRASLLAPSSARSAGARCATRSALARMARLLRGAASERYDGDRRQRRAGAGHSGAPGGTRIYPRRDHSGRSGGRGRHLADAARASQAAAPDAAARPIHRPASSTPVAGPPLFRSYSLSGGPSLQRYRISVKIEPNGAAGTYLRRLGVGDVLDVSLPRGSFTLRAEERPLVLLSAGIGVTPVLSMLHSLAESKSTRQVFWFYQARDRQHHPFADEVRRLIARAPARPQLRVL